MANINYQFEATLWRSAGAGGWHFVTLPDALSHHIRQHHGQAESGWGRLKAKATINDSVWQTSIWFDTKANAYLLPVNAKIRKAQGLNIEQRIQVNVAIQDHLFDISYSSQPSAPSQS